jgi:hypothetical protein
MVRTHCLRRSFVRTGAAATVLGPLAGVRFTYPTAGYPDSFFVAAS